MTESRAGQSLARPAFWGEGLTTGTNSFALPAGTVTFLLSDVEGSARGWEADRGAMADAVVIHYRILDEAITGHGGVRPVEQGEGDSVVAAFARASDALGAALSRPGRSRRARAARPSCATKATTSASRSRAARACARSPRAARRCSRELSTTSSPIGFPRGSSCATAACTACAISVGRSTSLRWCIRSCRWRRSSCNRSTRCRTIFPLC